MINKNPIWPLTRAACVVVVFVPPSSISGAFDGGLGFTEIACLSTTAEVKFTVLIFYVRRRHSASWSKAQPCLLESYFIECLMSQDIKDKKLMGLNTGKAGSIRSFTHSSVCIFGTFQSCIERGPIPASHTHVRRHHLEIGCCYDSCVWWGLGSLNDSFSWSEWAKGLEAEQNYTCYVVLTVVWSHDGLRGCRHPPTDVIYFT